MPTVNEHVSHVKALYETEGTRSVLRYLNGLTDHRFTSLYRFNDETLKNLYFYDRQQPEVETSPEIPVMASYCVFVRDTEATFTLPNSLEDDRVLGHSKRQQVKSYCGVPLVDEFGRMFGTICHFDLEPCPIEDETILLLESVAQVFKGKLKA